MHKSSAHAVCFKFLLENKQDEQPCKVAKLARDPVWHCDALSVVSEFGSFQSVNVRLFLFTSRKTGVQSFAGLGLLRNRLFGKALPSENDERCTTVDV